MPVVVPGWLRAMMDVRVSVVGWHCWCVCAIVAIFSVGSEQCVRVASRAPPAAHCRRKGRASMHCFKQPRGVEVEVER
eukprot:7214735-Lingulodinium_polyedra.AAC.1